jgi:hypothetical protein
VREAEVGMLWKAKGRRGKLRTAAGEAKGRCGSGHSMLGSYGKVLEGEGLAGEAEGRFGKLRWACWEAKGRYGKLR